MYLGWFDDTKKATEQKIREAIAAYVERFRCTPSVILVSADEDVPAVVDGVPTRVDGYVRRNNYWAGVVE